MKRLTIPFVLLGLASTPYGQPTTTYTLEQQALIDEHVYGGLPSNNPVLVRQGYITEYDATNRIPRWVAYHVVPGYLETPRRRGHSFREIERRTNVSRTTISMLINDHQKSRNRRYNNNIS